MVGCPEPRIRMRFASEETYNFYNVYGRNIGFGIRRAYCHKSTEDPTVIVQRTYVCSKQGKRKESDKVKIVHRAESRIGYGAKMSISLQADGQYKCKSTTQATEIDLAERTELGTKLTFDLWGFHAGGNENLGFTKKDLQNYLNTKRQRDLAFGEVGSLILYLDKQREINSTFVYYLQMDNEEKITNIFWADYEMQCDYELFGDVVVFYTTFCTNREYRPLCVFAGFNHHRTVVIFSAALLYDETVDSFKWLFETFCRSNGRRS